MAQDSRSIKDLPNRMPPQGSGIVGTQTINAGPRQLLLSADDTLPIIKPWLHEIVRLNEVFFGKERTPSDCNVVLATQQKLVELVVQMVSITKGP